MTSTLTEQEVQSRLDPAEVIAAIEAAFRHRYLSVKMPTRTHVPLTHGTLLAMVCYDPQRQTLGTKFVTVKDHPEPGHPSVQATYLLLDVDTAVPYLTVAANYLTDLRTAATSAVATKYLARKDVQTLGIFGAGRLARTHAEVLPLVRRFQRILVCGRDAARTAEFVQQFSLQEHASKLAIQIADPRTCASESDVLCTCTSSATPLFDGHDLRPGTHLNLLGSFQPHKREADTTTIQRARLVVETYQAALTEPGDILIPMQQAAITRDHIAADLHELTSGKKQGRTNEEEITVFKSMGCALEDLVTAELLLREKQEK